MVILFSSGRWRRCGRNDRGALKETKELRRLLSRKKTGRIRQRIKKRKRKKREYASRVWGCVKRGFLDGVGFLEGGRWLGLFLLLEDGGRERDVVLGRRELGRE